MQFKKLISNILWHSKIYNYYTQTLQPTPLGRVIYTIFYAFIRGYNITLDFSSLLKNHFECSFVSSECSLQSSNVCFEVRSEYLR